MCFNEFNKDLFQNKYRIKSARVPKWDYSSDGYYFITICIKDHEHFFGEIRNRIIYLNELGCIVNDCWKQIPLHFPFVKLDEFVVMQNHVHGIIQIKNSIIRVNGGLVGGNGGLVGGNGGLVETQNLASLRKCNKFGPQSKNLASVIRGFKIGVKKYANQNNIDFHWQPRYHDRIIRNQRELNIIREYIKINPQEWKRDRNNKFGLWI